MSRNQGRVAGTADIVRGVHCRQPGLIPSMASLRAFATAMHFVPSSWNCEAEGFARWYCKVETVPAALTAATTATSSRRFDSCRSRILALRESTSLRPGLCGSLSSCVRRRSFVKALCATVSPGLRTHHGKGQCQPKWITWQTIPFLLLLYLSQEHSITLWS